MIEGNTINVSRSDCHPWRLLLIVMAFAGVWLVVLPWISNRPQVQEHITRNRDAGIDPGAVFYTEHPGARDWKRSIEHKIMSNHEAFWGHR